MDNELLSLTADIVSAHVGNNNVGAAELPELIASTFAALTKASAPVELEPTPAEPAVPIRSSVKPDYIVCLEDGAKLKMLKRYLNTRYNMTPEEYRTKWGLPRDYPMVAPKYAETRRTLAHASGLGRKKVEEVLAEPAAVAPKARKAAKKTATGLASAREHLSAAGQNAEVKKRGRPPKSKAETQQAQDAPVDRDDEVVREPTEG